MSKIGNRIIPAKWGPPLINPSAQKLLSRQNNVREMAWMSFSSKGHQGGWPQGATLGLLEYMSQSNHSADCVDVRDRFKFVDDLSILEIVNQA